eukprot:235283-Prymnesium_polylepis.1
MVAAGVRPCTVGVARLESRGWSRAVGVARRVLESRGGRYGDGGGRRPFGEEAQLLHHGLAKGALLRARRREPLGKG